jgi:hypothetical protein
VDTEQLKLVIELAKEAGLVPMLSDRVASLVQKSMADAADLGRLHREVGALRTQQSQARDEAAAEAVKAIQAQLRLREELRGLREAYDALLEEAGELRKQLAGPVRLIHVALKLLGVAYEYDAGQWVLSTPLRWPDNAAASASSECRAAFCLCSALDELDPKGDTAKKETRTC